MNKPGKLIPDSVPHIETGVTHYICNGCGYDHMFKPTQFYMWGKSSNNCISCHSPDLTEKFVEYTDEELLDSCRNEPLEYRLAMYKLIRERNEVKNGKEEETETEE